MSRRQNSSIFNGLLCFCLVVLAVSAQDCDKSKCEGPVRYYEELGCEPNFEKEGDCCAVSYDCTHLESRSTDKCYVNGETYNIGESLKDKDRSGPCDLACVCVKGPKGIATFSCAQVDCPQRFVKQGCFFRRQLDSCCDEDEVCPKDNEKIETCNFKGTTYKYGEVFYPNDRHACQCSKTINNDKQMEVICRKINCGIELRRSIELRDNCPPVFLANQTPSEACSYEYKCQGENDKVNNPSKVTGDKSKSREAADNMKCKFGNMTMNIGEELSQENDARVKCVCEVPPMLTCKNIS